MKKSEQTMTEARPSRNQSSFYTCFRQAAEQTDENEYCATYRFSYRGWNVVLKKTLQKANKHTVIACENRDVVWEQIYPCGISPVRERTCIGNDSFSEKGAINLYVISGKPGDFQNLDTGIYRSADSPSSDGIYVMSETRLKSFEPC